MIKTVIFDLDGLLIDSETMGFKIYGSLLEKYGDSLSLAEYTEDYCGHTASDSMARLIAAHSLPITHEEGMAFIDLNEREYISRGIPLKKGTRELLKFLYDEKIAAYLASSSTKLRGETILKNNGVFEFFKDSVFGNEIKNCKPAPDIFIAAQRKAKTPCENCLVLEDSEAGIKAAVAANIPVICIPDLKIPRESTLKLTKCVLSSLDGVIDVIKKENGENAAV